MKLKDCCRFIRGLTYKKSDETDHSSKVVLRANNINLDDGTLDFSELKYINDAIVIPPDKIVKKGDILICTASGSKSHLGKVALIDRDYGYAFGGFMAVLKPFDFVEPQYLHAVLNSPTFKAYIFRIDGANINNLKFSDMEDFEFPIPPISEQKRIVGILDAAFEKIDAVQRNAERNLANAKELFQRVLDEEMTPKDGWEKVAFKDLFDIRDGTHDSPQYHAQGHPLITSKNLKSGTLDYNNVKLISDDDFIKINERSKVDRFDLLFAMIGTIGNPIVIEDEPGFAIKNVALFKNKPTQNMYFLKYYLNTSVVHNKMICDAQGSNQKFVGLAYLRNFQTLYPSRLIQDAIVRKLNVVSSRCDSLVCALTSQLQMYTELRQQILAKAFNGEL